MPINAIIFDMDGVLIDATELHYAALNAALASIGITIKPEDHLSRFNGLPTRKKLQILSDEIGLPIALHELVFELKQIETLRLAAQNTKVRIKTIEMLERLTEDGLALAVATNSIRLTTELFLNLAGIRDYFRHVISNEDIARAKPYPDIYLHACELLGIAPSNVLVIEDSEYGVTAASSAGCHVLKIDGPADLNLHDVIEFLDGL
jgi:HAD superfamily hydrolase (TIGR01509 family)